MPSRRRFVCAALDHDGLREKHLGALFSASSRDRTYDLVLKRDLLYQLSYGRAQAYSIPKKQGIINYVKVGIIGVVAKW